MDGVKPATWGVARFPAECFAGKAAVDFGLLADDMKLNLGVRDHFLRAEELFVKKRYADAAALAQRGLELSPEYWPLTLLEGWSLHEEGADERAYQALEAAARLNPNLPGLYYLRGGSALMIGRYPEAVSDLERYRNRPEAATAKRADSAKTELAEARAREALVKKGDYADLVFQTSRGGSFTVRTYGPSEARAELLKLVSAGAYDGAAVTTTSGGTRYVVIGHGASPEELPKALARTIEVKPTDHPVLRRTVCFMGYVRGIGKASPILKIALDSPPGGAGGLLPVGFVTSGFEEIEKLGPGDRIQTVRAGKKGAGGAAKSP